MNSQLTLVHDANGQQTARSEILKSIRVLTEQGEDPARQLDLCLHLLGVVSHYLEEEERAAAPRTFAIEILVDGQWHDAVDGAPTSIAQAEEIHKQLTGILSWLAAFAGTDIPETRVREVVACLGCGSLSTAL